MQITKMNRRLRKKLYLGEFAVLGCEFSVSLSSFSEEQFNEFFDSLIDFIELRKLEIGGGGSKDRFSGYITAISRYGSVTEDDRSALEDWLSHQSGTSEISVKPLSDACYGI